MNYSTLTDDQLMASVQFAINSSQDISRLRLAYASSGLIKNTKREFIDREFGYTLKRMLMVQEQVFTNNHRLLLNQCQKLEGMGYMLITPMILMKQ